MQTTDNGHWQRWQQAIKALLESRRFLIVIVVLGLGARLALHLAKLSYWYDEAFLFIPVFERSALDLIGPLPTQTIVGPLFLWLLRGVFLLGGPGELVMRLPAFVAGILGVFVMIPLAVRLLGRPGGYWAVALCALSGHAQIHGSEVRSYTADFLAVVLILLAAVAYLQERSPRSWRIGAAALLFLVLAAPWLSFTSAFVLIAVSAATFLDALTQGGRRRWAFWTILNGLLLTTFALVWYVQARHMYYPGLKDHWRLAWDGFPADDTWLTMATWSLRRFVGLGDYASSGLGFPLLILGLWGGRVLWRQSAPLAVLLAGPILITYAASLAGRYPFSDRTIFFLAPCLWCLAMAGLADLWQRLPLRWNLLVPVPLLVVMLVLGVCTSFNNGVRPRPRLEYREALVFLHDQRGPQDEAIIWCRHLNEAYFGYVFPGAQNPAFDEGVLPDVLTELAKHHRLWVLAPPTPLIGMIEPLQGLPVRETLRRKFHGVEVLRFDPP